MGTHDQCVSESLKKEIHREGTQYQQFLCYWFIRIAANARRVPMPSGRIDRCSIILDLLRFIFVDMWSILFVGVSRARVSSSACFSSCGFPAAFVAFYVVDLMSCV